MEHSSTGNATNDDNDERDRRREQLDHFVGSSNSFREEEEADEGGEQQHQQQHHHDSFDSDPRSQYPSVGVNEDHRVFPLHGHVRFGQTISTAHLLTGQTWSDAPKSDTATVGSLSDAHSILSQEDAALLAEHYRGEVSGDSSSVTTAAAAVTADASSKTDANTDSTDAEDHQKQSHPPHHPSGRTSPGSSGGGTIYRGSRGVRPRYNKGRFDSSHPSKETFHREQDDHDHHLHSDDDNNNNNEQDDTTNTATTYDRHQTVSDDKQQQHNEGNQLEGDDHDNNHGQKIRTSRISRSCSPPPKFRRGISDETSGSGIKKMDDCDNDSDNSNNLRDSKRRG